MLRFKLGRNRRAAGTLAGTMAAADPALEALRCAPRMPPVAGGDALLEPAAHSAIADLRAEWREQPLDISPRPCC